MEQWCVRGVHSAASGALVEKRGEKGAVARIRRMCGAWCGGGAIGPEQAREAAEVGAGSG